MGTPCHVTQKTHRGLRDAFSACGSVFQAPGASLCCPACTPCPAGVEVCSCAAQDGLRKLCPAGPSPRPDLQGRHLLRASRHRLRSSPGGAPPPGVGPHASPLAHWGAAWVGFSAWPAHPPLSPPRPSAECRSRVLSRPLPLPDTSSLVHLWCHTSQQEALLSGLCPQSTTPRRRATWPVSRVLWTRAPMSTQRITCVPAPRPALLVAVPPVLGAQALPTLPPALIFAHPLVPWDPYLSRVGFTHCRVLTRRLLGPGWLHARRAATRP